MKMRGKKVFFSTSSFTAWNELTCLEVLTVYAYWIYGQAHGPWFVVAKLPMVIFTFTNYSNCETETKISVDFWYILIFFFSILIVSSVNTFQSKNLNRILHNILPNYIVCDVKHILVSRQTICHIISFSNCNLRKWNGTKWKRKRKRKSQWPGHLFRCVNFQQKHTGRFTYLFYFRLFIFHFSFLQLPVVSPPQTPPYATIFRTKDMFYC